MVAATPVSRWLTRPVVGLAVALAVFGGLVACVQPRADGQWVAPAPSTPASTGSPSPAPNGAGPSPTSTPGSTAGTFHYVFPVVGNASYARTHHDYPASDIIAACGAQVRAPTDGVVLEVNRVDRWDPATDDGAWRGGRFLSILGDDGVRYYGAHFSSIVESLMPGARVAAGQIVGAVGTTGKSSACHLHFGISPPCGGTGDWAVRRGVIWPWSYLDSWRAGGAKSAVAEVAAWLDSHGCP